MRRRDLSPEFWTDERVVSVSDPAKLLFIGVLHCADREGRLEDRPMAIAMKVRPWDAGPGPALLDELVKVALVERYEVAGQRLIWVPRFLKWQHPHPREAPSVLPPPPNQSKSEALTTGAVKRTDPGRAKDRPSREKARPSRAGSSGSSGSSGLSGPSGSSDLVPDGSEPMESTQLPLVNDDPKVEAKERKLSPWQQLWDEKLKLDRVMQIAKNEGFRVDDPAFDFAAADIEVPPQLVNTLLKKVAADLEREFGNGREWSFEEKALALELAWEGYCAGSFGASVDPPYALNAFASPKTSLPSYRRAKAGL